MVSTADDTAMRFLIALIAGPVIGWALGYFIRKSIKIIAFIGGLFFFIMGMLYYSKTISNLSALQKGVENTLETAVNRTNRKRCRHPNKRTFSHFRIEFLIKYGIHFCSIEGNSI